MSKIEISKALAENYKELLIDKFREFYLQLDSIEQDSETRNGISWALEGVQENYNQVCEAMGEGSVDLVTLV